MLLILGQLREPISNIWCIHRCRALQYKIKQLLFIQHKLYKVVLLSTRSLAAPVPSAPIPVTPMFVVAQPLCPINISRCWRT
jgi:hypothetical protein